MFLLNSGHMAGGAGQATFVSTHRAELDNCVLELHLEHAANEFTDEGGATSGDRAARGALVVHDAHNRLESAVRSALEAEDIRRSYILRPDIVGPKPTTDGRTSTWRGCPS